MRTRAAGAGIIGEAGIMMPAAGPAVRACYAAQNAIARITSAMAAAAGCAAAVAGGTAVIAMMAMMAAAAGGAYATAALAAGTVSGIIAEAAIGNAGMAVMTGRAAARTILFHTGHRKILLSWGSLRFPGYAAYYEKESCWVPEYQICRTGKFQQMKKHPCGCLFI